jgi:predicted amidohydrolase YtcJ
VELTDTDRLDLAAMFAAYTVGSAYVNGREHTTGRIAPGFLADLVVLDRDVFADDDALRDASVEQTWIGGVQEYARPG